VDIQAVPIEPTGPVEQPVPTEPAVPPDNTPADEPRADALVAVEQPVQARVTVGEWPPLRIRYGFELADQEEPVSEKRELRPGVAADATYRNIFGRAATTGLALRYTKDFEAARAFLSKPSFFGLPLTSNLFLARSREQFGASTDRPFITDVSEFTAEQRFRVGRRLALAYSYNFQRNHTFDTNASPDDPLAFDVTLNIARVTATTLIDTRDDLVDATRGTLLSSTFEYGASALGSDLRFAKNFFQQNYYRTLGHGLVFATSGRLGVGAGYGQELIPSERFRAGGGNSVRGFVEDTLGPVDAFGDPAGGDALLVFNEELRFPIAGRFRGVGFFDAGNAFATIDELRLRRLRMGVGVGLRVKTPFALLRVDLGTPLAPRPGEPRARWFFSIGQAF
jgi:outer membrane protein assembly factor BamA